jgi:hypothetical protein
MSKTENRELIKLQLDTLERLAAKMDVPLYKRRNVSWLEKNLAVRNQGHKNFKDAMILIEELLKVGVSHG